MRVDQVAIEADLRVARRRAHELVPFSPAWDAATAAVEDFERQLWGLEPVGQTVRVPTVEHTVPRVLVSA